MAEKVKKTQTEKIALKANVTKTLVELIETKSYSSGAVEIKYKVNYKS